MKNSPLNTKLRKNRRRLILFFSILLAVLLSFWFLLKFFLGDLNIFLGKITYLTGFSGEKKYLVILQNNNELRPSGGFISAYGILKIKRGIPKLTISDSYNLTETTNLSPAPEAFQYFLKDDPKFKGWFFRDGNFSPNFPQSARDLLKLYKEQSGETESDFTGVIAVNFSFLEELLKVYPNIKIQDQAVNQENLFSFLQFNIKNIDTHNIADLESRKNILQDFGKTLMSKMFFSPFKYSALKKTLIRGLNEKNILLYFPQEKLQKKVLAKKWGGTFLPEKYFNFLHVNIANIGGRKADRYISKKHEILIKFDKENQGHVEHTLSLQHNGTYNLHSDRYQAYIRFFIPEKCSLEKLSGDFIQKDFKEYPEEKYSVSEVYLKMLPGEQRTISLSYDLSTEVTSENFSLDLIKQPGTQDFWEINLQMPNDISFRSVEGSSAFLVHENLGIWREELKEDLKFEIEQISDKTPPIIIWQKFINLKTIEVNFSEELAEDSLKNLENFKLIDLNHINKNSDDITVTAVEKKNNTLYLTVSGITWAEEERYHLVLTDLQDLSGNTMHPNPMIVTVVQRL